MYPTANISPPPYTENSRRPPLFRLLQAQNDPFAKTDANYLNSIILYVCFRANKSS